jgi:GntR family transcriptional regulator / MocR family aminotransferase
MPKRAIQTSRPEILLDGRLSMPLYKQLYERFRRGILTGQLERGVRLPSTRHLANELGISRTTAVLAYERLLLEGYLQSRVGRGTVVAHDLPIPPVLDQPALTELTETPADALQPSGLRLASQVHLLQEALAPLHFEGSPRGAYQGGEPAVEQFPYETWARLIARRARQSLREAAHYQAPAGYFPLREAIATHLNLTRGVRCTPEQVILTTGSQGAIDLAVRTLLNPGEEVWLENPGYFGARGAMLAAGARLIPVAVNEQGLDVDSGRQRCPSPRLIWTTPSHQFPTGVTMSLPRRMNLLECARRAEAWILEDDYDSEYRWSGRPLEALQGLDDTGRVLYIGTFSKVLFPALRLGYLVAPTRLLNPLLATRYFRDIHLPVLEQMALCDFLHEGHYGRYLRQTLRYYRQRRELLLTALRAHLRGLLEIYAPEAGLRLVGWLPPDIDDRRAAELAATAGVEVAPLSRYSLEALPRGGLLLSFASSDQEELLLGVKRLAVALKEL